MWRVLTLRREIRRQLLAALGRASVQCVEREKTLLPQSDTNIYFRKYLRSSGTIGSEMPFDLEQ